MTNEQILRRAIEKAKKGGWELADFYIDILDIEDTYIQNLSDWFFIFSHDFAKAFFGEGDILIATQDGTWDGCNRIPVYIYELQQMVKEKEPLQYLKKFIK